MFKKFIAGIASVSLALGMVALTAGPAAADATLVGAVGEMKAWSAATNAPAYWKNYGPHAPAECYSHDGNSDHGSVTDGGLTVTLNPFNQDWPGDHWELLIIKGGSVSNNVIVHPQAGVAYASPLNDAGNQANVSHWIVCKGTTPTPQDAAASVTVVPPSCAAAGSATFSLTNATWQSTPPTTPGAHTITAVATNGHLFPGGSTTKSFNYTILGQLNPLNTECLVKVTPPPPSTTDGVCTAIGVVGKGSIAAPAGPWVGFDFEYRVRNTNWPYSWGSWTDLDPSEVVQLSIGRIVEIRAVALSGYSLTGTTSWNGTIGGPPYAFKCIQAATPTVDPAVCIKDTPAGYTSASVFIPADVEGVQFEYWDGDSWEDISAGSHTVPSLPYTAQLRAIASAPWTFVSGSITSWTFELTVPEGGCLIEVHPVTPSFTDTECLAPGQPSTPEFTITAATGVKYQVKIGDADWADVGSGSHDATPGVLYQFRALALFGYTPGETSLGSFTFAVKDCYQPATPKAEAIEPVCDYPEEGDPILGPSFVRVYWNAGIASYDIEGYGTVYRPLAAPAYQDIDTGVPSEELTVTPTALSGYTLTTEAPLTVTFDEKIINQCGEGLIGDPIATDEQCVRGTGQGGSVWVERMEGLRYTISGTSGGSPITPIVIDGVGNPGDPYLDGTVPLEPGDYVVTTTALPGYVLDPDPDNLPFEFTINEPEENCIVTVGLQCAVSDGQFTVPALAHVVWTVDVPSDGLPPLFTNVPGGFTIPITLAATHISASLVGTGYVFENPLLTSWFLQLSEGDLECGELDTLPPIPTAATVTNQQCVNGQVVGATLTVGQVDDENWFPEVYYYLDGSATPLATITSPISVGNHTVTAEPVDPDNTIAEGYPSVFPLTVLAAPATCGDLTTLALTGIGTNPIGWAGIGYYLLVTGLALIAVRTLRRRSEVKQ